MKQRSMLCKRITNRVICSAFQLSFGKIHFPVSDPDKSYDQLNQLLYEQQHSFSLCIIGPHLSDYADVANSVLFLDIPLLSHGATSSMFDNYVKRPDNLLFRSVPSDTYRLETLRELINKLEWNYLATIASSGTNGNYDLGIFISRMSEDSVCFSTNIFLEPSTRKAQL